MARRPAGIERARLVVAALSSAAAVRSIVSTIASDHPLLPVVARATHPDELVDEVHEALCGA